MSRKLISSYSWNGLLTGLSARMVIGRGRFETASGETQFARGYNHMVHCRLCFHHRQIFNKLEDPQFNFHSVSWDHWGQESHVIDGAKHQELPWLRSGSSRF